MSNFSYFQVNIAVFNVNLGGVFNCLAYTFVRRHNASGGRREKGNKREARRENKSASISASNSASDSASHTSPVYIQRLWRDSRFAATWLLNSSQSNPPASILVAITAVVTNTVCNSTVHNLCNWFGKYRSVMTVTLQSLHVKRALKQQKQTSKWKKRIIWVFRIWILQNLYSI